MEWLHAILEKADGPIKRDDLVERLRDSEALMGRRPMSREAAARYLRSARRRMQRRGIPVVSLGAGFFVATRPEDVARAVAQARKAAIDALVTASKLAGISLEEEIRRLGEQQQLDLLMEPFREAP